MQTLILVWDLNHPDICQKSSTASCKQSKRLLECMDVNFLTQVIESPTREEVLLEVLLTNTDELERSGLLAAWAAVTPPGGIHDPAR